MKRTPRSARRRARRQFEASDPSPGAQPYKSSTCLGSWLVSVNSGTLVCIRIAPYEMAFRMQTSVPELTDTSQEPKHVLDLYGCAPGDGSFASNCLLARRLAERGVRFIQLYHKDWDHHGGVKEGVRLKALEVDRACMALITDLKQRG